jgi:glycosyltransferase involved in cell wall biosynthesis
MLDIVVPVYNEGKNIRSLFGEIGKVEVEKSVVLVYDFEGDDTVPAVLELQGACGFPVRIVRNAYGNGALNAIKTGLFASDNEACVVLMADLSDSIGIIPDMLSKIREGYDVVCGSRYMAGGSYVGGNMLKKLLSMAAGLSLRVLAGVPTHDITNSFKMYSRNLLNNVLIESTGGFELGMEIVVKAYCSGCRITELPSRWRDRAEGESRFKLREWLPHYLHWYWYCLKNSRKAKKRASGPASAGSRKLESIERK